MLSALGGVKPAWENYPQQLQMTPRTTRDGMPGLPEPPIPDNRPYHVGRQRARGQLRTAMETRNESAQLRRLEHALLTRAVHDDGEISREVERAADVAFNLSQRLRGTVDDSSIMWNEDVAASEAKVPAARPSAGKAAAKAGPHEATQAEEEDKEAEEEGGDGAAESHAAVKIQSMYRGRMEREQLRKHAAEEEAAALRIQSVYRGNVARAHGGM